MTCHMFAYTGWIIYIKSIHGGKIGVTIQQSAFEKGAFLENMIKEQLFADNASNLFLSCLFPMLSLRVS